MLDVLLRQEHMTTEDSSSAACAWNMEGAKQQYACVHMPIIACLVGYTSWQQLTWCQPHL